MKERTRERPQKSMLCALLHVHISAIEMVDQCQCRSRSREYKHSETAGAALPHQHSKFFKVLPSRATDTRASSSSSSRFSCVVHPNVSSPAAKEREKKPVVAVVSSPVHTYIHTYYKTVEKRYEKEGCTNTRSE